MFIRFLYFGFSQKRVYFRLKIIQMAKFDTPNKNIYFNLIVNFLYGTKFHTVKEIAQELGITTRSISNYINDIKNDSSFSLESKNAKYRVIPNLNTDDLFLTEEDIDLLYSDYFFKKIDNDALSEKLVFLLGEYLKQKKKLFVSQDNPNQFRDYFKEVSIIKNAIKNDLCINIFNYLDRDEGKKNYRGVTPVKLDERRNKVYCLVTDKNNSYARAFNFERMSAITTSKAKALSKANCDIDVLLDVFGFLPKHPQNGLYKIGLRMTNFAYSLLIRQFPEIDNPKYISKSHKQKMPYTLKVKTNDPFAIARFFAGIASHVEIIEHQTDTSSRKKIREWFDDYARVGLESGNYI